MANPHPASGAAEAAARFLDGLDDEQRDAAVAPFSDEALRRDWHYVPRERPGLSLAQMDARQQKLALRVLETGFSTDAFAAACAVMSLEDPLDRLEGHGRGRHRNDYDVLVFSSPGVAPWGWRFEGHHLSVTMTVTDDGVVTVPHFLGANPAEIGGLRVLGREEDLALALLGMLSPSERATAIVSDVAPDDILTTNAASLDDVLPPDEGVRLGELAPHAQRAAARLVAVYLGREPRGRDVDVGALRFAFAGEPEHRRPHYYRLQGPQLLVEYDNTQNDANHVHTVVRQPGRDFGEDLLRAHHRRSH